ncbi:MAG: hypothetical protein QXR31_05710 [Zestosphaera sp.]
MIVGPESPYFYRLSKILKNYANKVYKINLSGGCFIFYPRGAINYRGKPSDFGVFLKEFVWRNRIDAVVMFNDKKLAHIIAKKYLGDSVEYFVFEKGYIRPHFISFEKAGVNGNSPLVSLDVNALKNVTPEKIEYTPICGETPYLLFYSLVYFSAFVLLKPLFPSSELVYRNILKIAIGRLFSVLKGLYFKKKEKGLIKNIVENLKNKYYFVPLQVYNDSQIRYYSPHKDVSEFIIQVIASFSINAPKDTYLVIKHHPIDLGYRNYTKLIKEMCEKYNVENRVFYIKSGDIDLLLKNSIGCITINSTVGMNALLHLKPTKVMGISVYNKPGLTYQGTLDDFWYGAFHFTVDVDLLRKFVFYIVKNSLINDSIYKKVKRRSEELHELRIPKDIDSGKVYQSKH